jgi:hypothetical protein
VGNSTLVMSAINRGERTRLEAVDVLSGRLLWKRSVLGFATRILPVGKGSLLLQEERSLALVLFDAARDRSMLCATFNKDVFPRITPIWAR